MSQSRANNRVLWVDQNHEGASDSNDGSADRPFRTISQAALVAEPGDVVRVKGGLYRERVAPRRGGEAGRPIVYEAAQDERVVVRGSEVWNPEFTEVAGYPSLYQAKLDSGLFAVDQRQAEDWSGVDFPTAFNPFARKMSDAAMIKGQAVDVFGNVQAEAAEAGDTPGSSKRSYPRIITLGQVFIDGEPLLHVPHPDDAARMPGSFCVTGEGDQFGAGLIIHLPGGISEPANHQFEVTTRPRCFAPYRRGLGYITVRGFIFEHGATNFHRGFYNKAGGSHKPGGPQAGIVSTRSGHHWIIQDNVIRFGTSLGLDIGSEGTLDADELDQEQIVGLKVTGYHTITHNLISDHGSGGIQGIRSPYTTIAHNIIERTNNAAFTAPEIGAIKLHFFIDGVIEHNLIRDNDGFGIWLDNVFHRSRVHGNCLINNQGAGMFLELDNGPALVDNNIIAQTRGGFSTSGNGDGVYTHDVSHITFTNNLCFFNAGFGFYGHHATDRKPGLFVDGEYQNENRPSACSGWRITGNQFFGNSMGGVALPPEAEDSTDNVCDYNAYAGTLPRITSETYAANLDPANFTVCTNKGRVDLSTFLGKAGIRTDAYEGLPILTFEQWQQITGFDRHSKQVTVIRPLIGNRGNQLAFTVGSTLSDIQAPTYDAVTRDYQGVALKSPVVPGPFAQVVTDERLVPVEEVDPEQIIPGRGAFNKIDFSKRFQVTLWPIAAATAGRAP